jgi:hypothetical protein
MSELAQLQQPEAPVKDASLSRTEVPISRRPTSHHHTQSTYAPRPSHLRVRKVDGPQPILVPGLPGGLRGTSSTAADS